MARTKDPLRHAGLAEAQVIEALQLVNDELSKTRQQLNDLGNKSSQLQVRSDALTTALAALQHENS